MSEQLLQCLTPFGSEAAIEAIESLQGASDERVQQKALARKLDFPACDVPGHTAFEAAKANRNGPSMRVGPIRRRSGCCARVRAP